MFLGNEPTIICELLGNTVPPGAPACGFGSWEVKETSFRLDDILVPSARMPDLPIVFVEAQGYPERKGTLHSSFLQRDFLYLHDYQPVNDWKSVLIFTRCSPDAGLPKQYSDFANSPHFRRVCLDELGNSEDLSTGLSLLKLVVIKKTKVPALGRRLVERSRTELPDARRVQNFIELIVTIPIYKLGNVDRAEIESIITIPGIRKSRFFQEVKAEGREEGRITTVGAMLKIDISLERIAELLETDLGTCV